MGSCCHGSSKLKKSCCENTGQADSPAKSDRYVKWWAFGIFALVLGILWWFDGNPLVSQMVTPLILMGLVLIWFVKLIAQRMGIGRQ